MELYFGAEEKKVTGWSGSRMMVHPIIGLRQTLREFHRLVSELSSRSELKPMRHLGSFTHESLLLVEAAISSIKVHHS